MRKARLPVTALVLGFVGSAAFLFAGPEARAAGPDQEPSFSASASADGVRFTRFAPGGPVADQLIDLAGPTAQAALSSLGNSVAYAALPDPGSLVNSAPGLGVGLIGQGAGGLPPIPLPPAPPVPLQVTTSVSGKQDATFGVGPYVLTARSTDEESSANAGGGLLLGAGPAAELTSRAGVVINRDYSVTAESTSRTASFNVGSLTIGSIVSAATATLAPDGKITTGYSTQIVGASVLGVPVSFNGGRLQVNGTDTAAPADNLLAPLLQNGMRLTVQRAEAHEGTVIAPTFVLTVPFEDPAGKGTYALSFGGATVSMTGSGVASGVAGPSAGSAGAPTAGTPELAGTAPDAVLPATSTGAAPEATAPSSVTGTAALASAPATLEGMFDIRALYAALASLALGMAGISPLVVRLRGGHR
jgi:hypothetical protein